MSTRTETEQPESLPPEEIVAPNRFSQDVEIEGLPYVFKGTLPDAPSDFSLSVHTPSLTWEKLSGQVQKLELPKFKRDNPAAIRAHQQFLDNGQVGHVKLKDTKIYGVADLRLDYIASDTWLLP